MNTREWQTRENRLEQRDADTWLRTHAKDWKDLKVRATNLLSGKEEPGKTFRYRNTVTKLKEFWPRFRQCDTPESRLVLLREMADWVSYPICKKKYKRRRTGFDKHKGKSYPLRGQKCQVCNDSAQVRHHVIEVVNGGRNTKMNLMPLCQRCHAEVHPWLKT